MTVAAVKGVYQYTPILLTRSYTAMTISVRHSIHHWPEIKTQRVQTSMMIVWVVRSRKCEECYVLRDGPSVKGTGRQSRCEGEKGRYGGGRGGKGGEGGGQMTGDADAGCRLYMDRAQRESYHFRDMGMGMRSNKTVRWHAGRELSATALPSRRNGGSRCLKSEGRGISLQGNTGWGTQSTGWGN
eukprot:757427-Hanusia_phi.AAC.3